MPLLQMSDIYSQIVACSSLPGAITTEHIHHANAEKVTYENGSYARADSRTKKEKKKKKITTAFGNFAEHVTRGMRLLLRVPASSVYEEEDPLLAPPLVRGGSYVRMIYGVFANWSTRNETLEPGLSRYSTVNFRKIRARPSAGNNALTKHGR